MDRNSGLRISRVQFDENIIATLTTRFNKDRKRPKFFSCEDMDENATHILLNTIWNAGLYNLPPCSVEKLGSSDHSTSFVIRLPKNELRIEFNETAICMFTTARGLVFADLDPVGCAVTHIDDFVALHEPGWKRTFQEKLTRHIDALRDGPAS